MLEANLTGTLSVVLFREARQRFATVDFTVCKRESYNGNRCPKLVGDLEENNTGI